MFGTWKYDRQTHQVHSLPQVFDPVTGRSSQHQACDRCHEKKIKCSGEKTGCKRCKSHHHSCEYTRTSPRRGSRKTRSPRPSREESSSASQPSHNHNYNDNQSSPLPSQMDMSWLGQEEDMSWLGPEDGFDFLSISGPTAIAAPAETQYAHDQQAAQNQNLWYGDGGVTHQASNFGDYQFQHHSQQQQQGQYQSQNAYSYGRFQ